MDKDNENHAEATTAKSGMGKRLKYGLIPLALITGSLATQHMWRDTLEGYVNHLTTSGAEDDIAYSINADLIESGRAQSPPDYQDRPIVMLENSDTVTREFTDEVKDLVCGIRSDGDLVPYRLESLRANFWASVTKSDSLIDFELSFNSRGQFDLMNAIFENESRSGRYLLNRNARTDATGAFNISGGFHLERRVFATLLENHGPESVNRFIYMDGEDPHIFEGERRQILELRNDPVISATMTSANMYEASENIYAALRGQYPDFEVGPVSLFMHHIIGLEDTLKVLRAHLEDDPRPIDEIGLSDASLQGNSPLFYSGIWAYGSALPAKDVYESFEERYLDRLQDFHQRFRCDESERDYVSENRFTDSLWDYPAMENAPRAYSLRLRLDRE